jgi:hypothetical protein
VNPTARSAVLGALLTKTVNPGQICTVPQDDEQVVMALPYCKVNAMLVDWDIKFSARPETCYRGRARFKVLVRSNREFMKVCSCLL